MLVNGYKALGLERTEEELNQRQKHMEKTNEFD